MLIDSDLDSEAIPSPKGYLMRPLSPSISFSCLDQSNYSFGGLLELDKMMIELERTESKRERYSDSTSIYEQRVSELKAQIKNIQDLYSKEIIEHEAERKLFEQTIRSLKPDPFEETFKAQLQSLFQISDTLRSLQQHLKVFISK